VLDDVGRHALDAQLALKRKPLEAVRADVPVHEVSREEMVRINFLVPASVRKALKDAALKQGKTLTVFIVEAT
jgi:hypothetical protein